ncbi:MAG: saccharopine dehydrogenase NADP-binding domain-containing protein [Candidatus Marinimicrobia bacterium]|nr:saccharopine dehydrogenase NADP-binding domain-containing protein [Candidatus Neomarinimicrobiota bacterium]
MKQVLVLGGGLVGGVIARNLAAPFGDANDGNEAVDVVVADANPQVRAALTKNYGLTTSELDITDAEALTRAVQAADVVVGAVPGSLGYRMLETVIRAGRNVVDISFTPEDPLTLDDLAVEHGVTAVVDAGLAPGLSNLVLGRYQQEYDPLERFVCYVGGLPKVRRWPFEYLSVFSPIDVIEEYTRPVRLKVGGRVVQREALSDIEQVILPHVGSLEAFNTDGLRTLLSTVPVPDMLEKTLRYPGHAERMRMLRDTGFFSREPLDVDGHAVAPIEVSSRLLFESWRPGPGDEGHDLVVMRVELTGQLRGRLLVTTVDLYRAYDPLTETTAMAATTGYTCAAVARVLLAGDYADPGIRPLEYLGADKGVYQRVLHDLARQGVSLNIKQTQPD